MKEIKTQVSSIEAAIGAALERKKAQLNLKEKEFSDKLNQIKALIIDIESDLESFEGSLPTAIQAERKNLFEGEEKSVKKRGRPLPEETQQAYILILKTLNNENGLTVLEVASKLGDIEDAQFKKTTRKRMEKLEKEGEIEAINKNPLKDIQRNLQYRITDKGKSKLSS